MYFNECIANNGRHPHTFVLWFPYDTLPFPFLVSLSLVASVVENVSPKTIDKAKV